MTKPYPLPLSFTPDPHWPTTPKINLQRLLQGLRPRV